MLLFLCFLMIENLLFLFDLLNFEASAVFYAFNFKHLLNLVDEFISILSKRSSFLRNHLGQLCLIISGRNAYKKAAKHITPYFFKLEKLDIVIFSPFCIIKRSFLLIIFHQVFNEDLIFELKVSGFLSKYRVSSAHFFHQGST